MERYGDERSEDARPDAVPQVEHQWEAAELQSEMAALARVEMERSEFMKFEWGALTFAALAGGVLVLMVFPQDFTKLSTLFFLGTSAILVLATWYFASRMENGISDGCVLIQKELNLLENARDFDTSSDSKTLGY